MDVISILIIVVSLAINAYLFHRMAKQDGHINPIALLAALFPLLGTGILLFVTLFYFLEDKYEKYDNTSEL